MHAVAMDGPGAVERLVAAAEGLRAPVNFMEVCGTHTVSAFRGGIHSLMPENVQLLSGPGCPVCVTAQGEIDLFIELALRPGVTLCTYGDMLRVTGTAGTLERARGRGADVRVVYSPLDAVRLAKERPEKQVVFAAVGFETTTPGTAVAILEAKKRGLGNFSALASHKRIMPALRALLDGGKVNVAGFMMPGHVSIITGWGIFRPVAEEYGLPCVVAGFEPAQIAMALARLTEMVRDGEAKIENAYPQAVREEGNARALEAIERVFEPVDAPWRGLGVLKASGLAIRAEHGEFDARKRFSLAEKDVPEPEGCVCGHVITGRATPAQCRLFGTQCTPIHPVGPCMVSSEGTCQAWFKYGRAGARGVLR